MVNYVLLLDKNLTTDQKVVSSNPAGCAIKKTLHMEGFFNGLLDGREITAVSSG